MIHSKIMFTKIWKNGNYFKSKQVAFLEQWIEVNMDKLWFQLVAFPVPEIPLIGGIESVYPDSRAVQIL